MLYGLNRVIKFYYFRAILPEGRKFKVGIEKDKTFNEKEHF